MSLLNHVNSGHGQLVGACVLVSVHYTDCPLFQNTDQDFPGSRSGTGSGGEQPQILGACQPENEGAQPPNQHGCV